MQQIFYIANQFFHLIQAHKFIYPVRVVIAAASDMLLKLLILAIMPLLCVMHRLVLPVGAASTIRLLGCRMQ